MHRLRLLLAVLALPLVALPGCDRSPGPIDVDDLHDLDEDDADGLWARGLDIGDFLYTETSVHVWGSCTTTKSLTLEGDGECSVGSIGVGIEQPDGTLVAGGIGLCGTMTVEEVHVPSDFCGDAQTHTLEKGTAVFSLSAPREDDPMELASTHDDPDMTIATTIFAAAALTEPGTAKTLRLDGQGQSEDGLDRREISLVVDIVVQ